MEKWRDKDGKRLDGGLEKRREGGRLKSKGDAMNVK